MRYSIILAGKCGLDVADALVAAYDGDAANFIRNYCGDGNNLFHAHLPPSVDTEDFEAMLDGDDRVLRYVWLP
jgi:hypothetical protein